MSIEFDFGIPYVDLKPSNRIFIQEHPMSCGVACVRQILLDEGLETNETEIRDLTNFDEVFGTEAKSLAKTLNRIHPRTEFNGGSLRKEDFEALVRTGTWIARLKMIRGAHFVIIDGVDDDLVQVRDPSGIEGKLPKEVFLELWTMGVNQTVYRLRNL